LIQPMFDTDTCRFSIGPKPSLPVSIFGFALNNYFDSEAGARQTINFQSCLYGVGSPGQVFKLDENSLIEYIETLQDLTSGDILIDETAGLKQVYRQKSLDSIQLLEDYYSNKKA
jgi:tetrahydromethanopterin S-methyltransferase subunit H